MNVAMVTGSSGYIGFNLVKYLMSKGVMVIHYDLDEDNDILNYDNLSRKMEGCDTVFHLAAVPGIVKCLQDPRGAFTVNVNGTYNVLLAARKVEAKIVFASSLATQKRLSDYAMQKYVGELLCQKAGGIILRYANVYGGAGYFEKKKTVAIANFIRQASEGETLQVYGDGYQSRDFTYIDDIMEGTVKAAVHGVPGAIYELGTGKMTSINEVIDILRKHYPNLNVNYGSKRAGDHDYESCCDITVARNELKFHPNVRLEEGIKKTVEEFKRNI